MINKKLWVNNEYPDELLSYIIKHTGVDILLAKVFASKGISNPAYINKFLNPSLNNLNDPYILPDMRKSVDRIKFALENKERVYIYGDYDVDGITSTSILYKFLKELTMDVHYFIPDRFEEGYGLSKLGIDKILEASPQLIITVDCGITSFEEVDYINSKHVDIIITDHHECTPEIPNAYAVVNPMRLDSKYPFKGLAGVGVTYKLIHAIAIALNMDGIQNNYLDLVALGTVADVVPLVDENRILVTFGLIRINRLLNFGIVALVKHAGHETKAITSHTLGFILSPRINAAGRMGNPCRAVKLLTTLDFNEALTIANDLGETNKIRQDTEQLILKEIIEKIETDATLKTSRIIVLAGENWHQGVLGIVASKITEKYYKPCILFSINGEFAKGSSRSICNFNIYSALTHCSQYLKKFGGHKSAAGLTIDTINIDNFRIAINEYAELNTNPSDFDAKIIIDGTLDNIVLNIKSVKELEKLAPFGFGNLAPVFCLNKLEIADIKVVGKEKHLKLSLLDRKNILYDSIGFNMGPLINTYSILDFIDAAFTLEITTWNLKDSIQLNLKDITPNYEHLFDTQYFTSLHTSFNNLNHNPKDKDILENINYSKNRINENGVFDMINSTITHGGNLLILLNSPLYAKKIIEFTSSVCKGLDNAYKVHFNTLDSNIISNVNILINPIAQSIDYSNFTVVILSKIWANRSVLNRLLQDCLTNEPIIFYFDNITENSKDIQITKDDMVAIYMYLKTLPGNPKLIESIVLFAHEICSRDNVIMNCFKTIKAFEILEELKLIKIKTLSLDSVLVSLIDSKEKTDLDQSNIYRNFLNFRYLNLF